MIKNYIGQQDTILSINETLKACENETALGNPYPFRPIFLGGFTGTGKSNVAKAIKEQLAGKNFNYIEVPVDAGWRDIYEVFGKIQSEDEDGNITAIPYVIFWDEVQSQKQEIFDLFKALSTRVREKNVVRRQGRNFIWDPVNHLHILASNKPVDEATRRRMRTYNLTTYSESDMSKLIDLMFCRAYGIRLGDEARQTLMQRCKPLPGDLEEVCAPLADKAQADKVSILSAATVLEVLKGQGFFPLGLRRPDIGILNELTKGPKPVAILKYSKALSAGKKDCQERVDYLCSIALVEPVRNAYALTKAGVEYIRKVSAAQKAKKAAK